MAPPCRLIHKLGAISSFLYRGALGLFFLYLLFLFVGQANIFFLLGPTTGKEKKEGLTGSSVEKKIMKEISCRSKGIECLWFLLFQRLALNPDFFFYSRIP